jgi:hypothetical protein
VKTRQFPSRNPVSNLLEARISLDTDTGMPVQTVMMDLHIILYQKLTSS